MTRTIISFYLMVLFCSLAISRPAEIQPTSDSQMASSDIGIEQQKTATENTMQFADKLGSLQ